MNSLERTICEAIPRIQRRYERMTDWWLAHAPESFLQIELARAIAKKKNVLVFAEVSPKKIAMQLAHKRRGRPYRARKRFDLIVWKKMRGVEAVVEIKRAWRVEPVRADAKKIRDYLRHQDAAKVGYLLVYSDTDSSKRRNALERKKKIIERFNDWDSKLTRFSSQCIAANAFSPHKGNSEDRGKLWSWGYAVYKFELG